MADSAVPDSARQVLQVERRRRIVEIVQGQGYVRARTLADQFGVTNETIRRDLMELEDAGMIARAHGGATTRIRSGPTADQQTPSANEGVKRAIGRAAATLVHDHSTIFIDSGFTTLNLAQQLRDKQELVVVTNAVTHAAELMGYPNITVVMIGGVVSGPSFSTAGDVAVASLGDLAVDQTFLAVNSVSVEKGLMYPRFDEVPVKRAMIAAAAEVILVADSSKFTERALVRVGPLSLVQRIVTDSGLPEETAAAVRSLGIDLIIVDPGEPAG